MIVNGFVFVWFVSIAEYEGYDHSINENNVFW